jgi:hypothetical protein
MPIFLQPFLLKSYELVQSKRSHGADMFYLTIYLPLVLLDSAEWLHPRRVDLVQLRFPLQPCFLHRSKIWQAASQS